MADTERLAANTDDDSGDRPSSAAQDGSPAADSCTAADGRGPATSTGRRGRVAAVATSVVLLGLLLMTSCAFCVWTMMRLSRVEARLERLERTATRPPISHAAGPPHSDSHFTRRPYVCILS